MCVRLLHDGTPLASADEDSDGDADAEHDEEAQRDEMYEEVYDEEFGGGASGDHDATQGEAAASEDYGSLEYDYYREDDGAGGEGEVGHDGGGGSGGGRDGAGQTEEGIDIYGDVDEAMDLAAPGASGDQHEQPVDQQQPGSRPQSAGGLKGGRHPANLGLRGGGRRSRSRSASRENDRWGGTEDRRDRPGETRADTDTPDQLHSRRRNRREESIDHCVPAQLGSPKPLANDRICSLNQQAACSTTDTQTIECSHL